jgi:hypothetical protein
VATGVKLADHADKFCLPLKANLVETKIVVASFRGSAKKSDMPRVLLLFTVSQ